MSEGKEYNKKDFYEESSQKKQQNRTILSKKKMLEAMEKTFGIVTTAAKVAGIARTQHYKWIEEDPLYKKAIEDLDCDNTVIDFAESKLHKKINDGDTTALIFFLKTRAKRRGYVERMEHTGADGNQIQLQIVVNDSATKDAIDKI